MSFHSLHVYHQPTNHLPPNHMQTKDPISNNNRKFDRSNTRDSMQAAKNSHTLKFNIQPKKTLTFPRPSILGAKLFPKRVNSPSPQGLIRIPSPPSPQVTVLAPWPYRSQAPRGLPVMSETKKDVHGSMQPGTYAEKLSCNRFLPTKTS